MAESGGPLAGVVVVDFGMNIAGPYAASVLSDFGADVIKVEGPGGDSGRDYPPSPGGVSSLFASVNHGKRYLGLDLRQPGARPVIERLCERSDVVIQNLRPGKAAELGIDAASCHRVNPRLVHCSVEAFYADDGARPGYDLMVQAESGLLGLTGEEHGGPCRTPGSILDHVTSLWVALGAMAALSGKRSCETITVTMLDVAMALLNDRASAFVATGELPRRMGSSLATTTPHRVYPTSDGDLVVGAPNDGLFRKLAALVGPPVEGDDRFADQAGRLAHRGELDGMLERVFRTDTTAAWLQRLDLAGIPAAHVRDLADAVDRHRALSATGFCDLGDIAGLSIVAPPVRIGAEPWQPPVPGPVGADNRSVLSDVLGFDSFAVDRLAEEGIVVAP